MEGKSEGLGLWTRVFLYFVLPAMIGLVVAVLVVARFPQEALGVFGAWLMLYRLLIRTSWRRVVQVTTSFCSGASIALLTPLLSERLATVGFPLLVVIGGVSAAASYRVAAWIASASIGSALGALLWQLGLCSATTWFHALLGIFAIAFILIFGCTPLIGWIERAVFPMLGALLVALSAGPLAGGLAAAPLFEDSPCEAADMSAAIRTAAGWLVLALCGVGFQYVMLLQPDNGENEELAEFLLPGQGGPAIDRDGIADAAKAEGGPAVIPEKDSALSRHPILCEAIYADEGANQSHLTDHEKKIVAICRTDEFERDRVLWGGGLL